MNAILMQSGKSSFADENGQPLINGTVTFYSVGTNTPKDTWRDTAKTVLNTNPVILDARGEASIYGDGAYRQVLRDSEGNLIWDQVVPDLLGAITETINSLYLTSSIQVDTIASLKGLSKLLYKNAETRGYYSVGDLGAGRYWLDTTDLVSVDNGGTIIVATDGGRWKLVHDGSVSLRQFGLRINYTTDDTAALNKAIAWAVPAGCELVHPGGICKLTSTINLPGAFPLRGIGVESNYRLSMSAQTKYGSWFYLAHAGKGFVLSTTTTGQPNTSGMRFKAFGTIRDQPAPAAVWTPNDNDFDFWVAGYGSCDFEDITALNATRAIYCEQRANINRCKGQAFKAFIQIDNNYDTTRVTNCHQWPFWSEEAGVMNYSRANLRCYSFLRSDNPMMSNCFCYAALIGVYLGFGNGGAVGPTGVTSRLKADNVDVDSGYYGVFCDTEGVTAQFTDFTYTGWIPTTGSIGIYSNGLGNTLEFKGLRITNANDQAVFVQKNNNVIKVTDLWIDAWNTGNTAKPAISSSDNAAFISSNPIRVLRTSGNNADIFGGNGTIYTPLGSGFAQTATTNASGNVVVAHPFGMIPVPYITSYSQGAYLFSIVDRNATNFTVRVTNSATGAIVPLTNVSFAWDAKYILPVNVGN